MIKVRFIQNIPNYDMFDVHVNGVLIDRCQINSMRGIDERAGVLGGILRTFNVNKAVISYSVTNFLTFNKVSSLELIEDALRRNVLGFHRYDVNVADFGDIGDIIENKF